MIAGTRTGGLAIALVGMTIAAIGVFPSTTSALTKTERVSDFGEFLGETCGSSDTARVKLSWRGWSDVEPVSPRVGERVPDTFGLADVVITDFRTEETYAVWTATDTRPPAACPPPGPFEFADYSWWVDTDLVAEYQRRVKLHRLKAERLAERALRRKKEFRRSLNLGYLYRERCKRGGSVRFRCRVGWVIGDSRYSGTVAVWLTKKRDRIRSNYHYRIRRLNEYCVAVENKPRSRCSKRYRGKGRL